MSDGFASWVVTAVITALALVLRMHNVSFPRTLVFDETYYPKDAWTMLHLGYEGTWPDAKTANTDVVAGQTSIWNAQAEFVVHPPLGKWLIAAGEQMFGMNSFGWRFMSVIFGSLMILMTIRLARRLARSTLVGAIAGILLSLDGLSFVMSRIGLLDIFQAFFLVAGVAAVAADRDWFRHRLADHLRAAGLPNLAGGYGPALWFRPWRIAAGLMFGCAIAVKWNSMFVLASMGIISLCWDWSARRLDRTGPRPPGGAPGGT
ncbi:MAG: phospholipid carrier-dependent glycosyltransferase, partial [Acidipropionibacterium jensenii]|nr:phospholipid carrier-dependent glycosyltransferase [Acidipropionibacterium jensenii]